MAVEGCARYTKLLLLVFIVIFWLSGGALLCGAVWYQHDGHTSYLLSLQKEQTHGPNTFSVCVYMLIAMGALMILVGFLGCCGAVRESQCLLGSFFVCVLLLAVCALAGGIWAFLGQDSVSEELIHFYDQAYNKSIAEVEPAGKQAAVHNLHFFHESLHCCGTEEALDEQQKSELCPKMSGPFDYRMNCHRKLRQFFPDKLYPLCVLGLVVGLIMVCELILSMLLCCKLRHTEIY